MRGNEFREVEVFRKELTGMQRVVCGGIRKSSEGGKSKLNL